MLSCEPQANCAVFERADENAVTLADTLKDSESTEKAFPENKNENGSSGYSDKQGGKRQPKVTQKGKSNSLKTSPNARNLSGKCKHGWQTLEHS